MKKKRVLTVDDSRAVRDLLAIALTEAGFEIVQAVDGLDGLDALARAGADIIITDMNMPRLDGVGFIERVRGDLRYQATPILVLTTEEDPSKKKRARQAGATGWIVKPFNPLKLIDVIRCMAG